MSAPPAVKGAALVAKALELLNLIGAAPAPISAGALTARAGWPRASVYRILSALTAAGYARIDAQHGYLLGYRFHELAQSARQTDALTDLTTPELRRLRNLTGETGYLVAFDDGAAVALSRLESPHAHRALETTVGGRRPLHCTAHGKAMLAGLPAAVIERLIAPPRLTPMTAATITDPDELRQHLHETRARGFAIDDEEVVEGVRAVGAAILDADGQVMAAISIAGPAWRLTPGRAMQLGPEIAAAAQKISRRLAETRPPMTDPAGAQPLAAAPDAAGRGMSPIWDAGRGRLLWLDAGAPGVFATDAARTAFALPPLSAPPSALLLGPNGPLALLPDGIVGVDAAGARHFVAAPGLAGVAALRAAQDGAVWAARAEGDDRSAIGPLQGGRVMPAWRLPGPVTALAWDHAQDTLYAAAPAQGTVHALRRGAPARLLARLPAVSGAPTALAADREGRLWVAMLDGWGVVRLNEYGDVDATLALPAPRPTGLAFGGADLRTLFITTARDGLAEDAARHAPLSGRVFALAMDAAGWAEPVAILDLG